MDGLIFGNVLAWAAQVMALGAAGILLPMMLAVHSPRARGLYLRTLLLVCLVLPIVQPWVPTESLPRSRSDAAALERDIAGLSQAAPAAGVAAR